MGESSLGASAVAVIDATPINGQSASDALSLSNVLADDEAVPDVAPGGNSAYPWDDFDPAAYVDSNYRVLRDDDRAIISRVGRHFSERLGSRTRQRTARGIDVGTGPNLYPAMAMLPFCHELSLSEHSQSNVQWLEGQLRGCDGYESNWNQFWDAYCDSSQYDRLERDPRRALYDRAEVVKIDIFDLPERHFDVGTMFFVAESCTRERNEFVTAVHNFFRLLRPGAPFAAAFMLGSKGYRVGDVVFPAVSISERDVRDTLEPLVSVRGPGRLKVEQIETTVPLRNGYGGMLLALGTARSVEQSPVSSTSNAVVDRC
jgi:hypothetical protein